MALIIANTLEIPSIFQAGIATYEFWLKAGIVLLGARFVVADVLKLGGISLVLVALEIGGSLALMTLLGRIFRLRPKLTNLLAIGSSICGVWPISRRKVRSTLTTRTPLTPLPQFSPWERWRW
jgi:uncharacterized membrane protein YadS